ncbi:putative serine/threonine-protein kinase PIX13 [Sesamum angolense]|uniref:Serine/threonine-protein kinase PIX13 n=1 Tax=Sesamum angolense TaxID=2727404 RepID=A0AAE1T438_9LAMI|nr:putative serine/threonine-protein kinase PIX13 [Sesamum angolense]
MLLWLYQVGSSSCSILPLSINQDFSASHYILEPRMTESWLENRRITSNSIVSNVTEALLSVALMMIALTVVVTLITCVQKTQKQEKKPLLNKDVTARCCGLYRFSKAEIENAINCGNEKILLGRGRAGHPNIVCLLGYCIENLEQYLVYEYCSNGNLVQHLLRKDTVLTWDLRVKILRTVQLHSSNHNHVDGSIVHGDIKAKLTTSDMN